VLNFVERVDRRIQRTQRALMDGLIALALERGYDSITIRDLTDRANVAYSTFFRHYASLDDLLAELLQSVVTELAGLIDHQPNRSPEAEGLLIFRHVAANAAFFRLLFSSQGASRVMRAMQDRLAAEVLASNAIPPNSPIPPEVAANHFVATILALIDWWLRHDLPYPVERMAAIYSRLIAQGFASAVAPE
jgi:AcrR family transcriptional regulator